ISFFFFSSRRRHTRSYGDWSSDVCSSDLVRGGLLALGHVALQHAVVDGRRSPATGIDHVPGVGRGHRHLEPRREPLESWRLPVRSEERRVGKEGGSRWWGCPFKAIYEQSS